MWKRAESRQCGSGLNTDIFPLYPLTCKIPVRAALCAQRRNRECKRHSLGQAPEERPCTELASCGDPGGSRGYKLLLGKRDASCGRGFAYLLVDATAQNTKKGLKQKIFHQFSSQSHISSDQRTHFHSQINTLTEN